MSEAILARASARPLPSSVDVPTSIMWMPAGVHTINAWQAGNKVVRTVRVDAQTADTMNRALQAERSSGHRPLIDFDHEHKAAAAWPVAYTWAEGQGVMVSLEWSDAGRAAIAGKTHRAFSPEFFANKTGQITGAPKHHGGLVNDPAFEAIAPIWARSSASEHSQPINMETTTAPGTAPAAAAPAAAPESDAAIQAVRSENETLRAQLAQRDAAIQAARTKEADQAIRAAVARGAIPAKDQATQDKWKSLIIANPENADLLGAIPGNPAMQASSSASRGTIGSSVEVRDGLLENLRSYQAASSSRERGLIYARDINPALAKGNLDMMSILAANALGTLSGDLVTQRALSLLKLRFPILKAITTDYSSASAAFGQTIKTRLRSVPAVKDYVAGTGYGTSDATTPDATIVLNAHKAVPISFNANELASTSRDLFGEQAEAAHYALGKALVDLLYSVITVGNFANGTIQAVAGFGRPTMTAVAKAMFNRAVPDLGRFSLLNPDYFEKLGQDSSILGIANFQRPEIITDYTLPPIAGFNMIQAVNLPTTGNLTGFCGTPDSLAIATRVPSDYTQASPGASHGSVSVVTNEDTGISVQLVQYVNHDAAAANWRIAVMAGVAVGNAATGQRITSA